MRRTLAPVGGLIDWDDEDTLTDMGIRNARLWLYALLFMAAMGCLGCVMSAAGDRAQGVAPQAAPKDSRQMLTPDRKPVGRPVEGF